MTTILSKEDEARVAEDLDLLPTALEQELTNLPGQYAYWSSRWAEAKRDSQFAKLDRERVAATLYGTAQVELPEQGRKTTEASVTAYIESHPKWIEAREVEIASEATTNRLWGILQALQAKRDALIQLASNERTERRGA